MTATFRTPGVYVIEEAGGPRPIESVGTSTPGFVGPVPNPGAVVDDPVQVTNWLDFRRKFVDGPDGEPAGPATHLARAVFGFFQNGGRLAYVVNSGPDTDTLPGGEGSRTGLDALSLVDEVAIVAAPGFTDPASHHLLLEHCENRKDRVAILDGPESFDEVRDLTVVAEQGVTTPARRGSSEAEDADDGEDGGDDSGTPPPPPPSEGGGGGLRPRISEYGFGAFYVPWLAIADPLGDDIVPCPPSGHLAGVWARTDGERGVHKAPANTTLRGALSLTRRITAAEQELLNPAGVNCIRTFPGAGTLVWGARTVAESSSEWRYLNVRRLFSMIEESILRSTRWIVFEPNDETLWKSIRRDVGAYLTRLWRSGALFGRTPEEAFFVQCDEETNPPEVRDAGQVVTVVGIAPVKPAEFVIFRVSQQQSGATVQAEGA